MEILANIISTLITAAIIGSVAGIGVFLGKTLKERKVQKEALKDTAQ